MLKNNFLASLIIAGSCSSAYASSLHVDLNDDVVEVGFKTAITAGAEFSANYLYSRPEGDLADIGIKASHRQDIHSFSIGAKFSKLWANHRDNPHSFAIGGDYSIDLANKLTLSASGYYAPSVLTSSQLSRYYDVDAKLGYAMMPQATVHIGYRVIQFRYKEQANLDFTKGLYIGAAFNF
ncbi:YfaZ family outer membrane protein [Agarivorans gilvus]|uniref:YfaZ n=1 Tax=Agarivorans gilvus TaxID=680279 RepID=A0ABQ1I7C7_9ALTE|nr:YfaZ family outer membrane protein [Agarivorans gilvus]GGB17268.1 hypothetical protein GCM10007414_33360 [Agarivorans gilvus]